MIQALLTIAAEGIVRDAETNTMSVFKILEELTAEGFPVLLSRMAFLVVWQRELKDPEKVRAEFTAHLDRTELLRQTLDIDFRGQTRNRTTFQIGGLVLPAPGMLVLSVSLDSSATATYGVEVKAVASAVQAKPIETTQQPPK